MSSVEGTGSSSVISTISASKPLSRNRCRSTTELPPSPYVPITSGSTNPIRTVESATAAPPERPVQLQERGVIRHHLDMSRRTRRDGLNGVVHQRVFDARITEPYRQIRSALPGGHHGMVDEMLEVDVPQP